MKNRRLHWLLRKIGPDGFTVTDLARAAGLNRGRVNDAINNKPGVGRYMRPIILGTLKRQLDRQGGPPLSEYLQALGWDERGCLIQPEDVSPPATSRST